MAANALALPGCTRGAVTLITPYPRRTEWGGRKLREREDGELAGAAERMLADESGPRNGRGAGNLYAVGGHDVSTYAAVPRVSSGGACDRAAIKATRADVVERAGQLLR